MNLGAQYHSSNLSAQAGGIFFARFVIHIAVSSFPPKYLAAVAHVLLKKCGGLLHHYSYFKDFTGFAMDALMD